MLLTRWDPFEIDREFHDLMIRFFTAPAEGPATWTWRPAMEVFREGGDLIVRAELPGIDPEKDVEVFIEGDMLHVKGTRSFDREVRDEHRYVAERAYGEFRRQVALPEGVDPDALTAVYESGVLTVTVPMPEALKAAEPKKIPVAIAKVKKLLGGKKDEA